ncbi:hypothetical protein ACQEPB_00360 [Novosphingobium fluoreni]|uniref:hypothetical protein n=1 Tax=Novosphingobium fluoreni TaxID=1391222 RepID=UPI003DA01E7E
MAISEDTAALVAAQLTRAWAANDRLVHEDQPIEDQLIEKYQQFFDAIRSDAGRSVYEKRGPLKL